MDVVDMINSFAEWCHETDEGCIVVTGDDRVLPFLSWDEAKHYYRERIARPIRVYGPLFCPVRRKLGRSPRTGFRKLKQAKYECLTQQQLAAKAQI